MQRNNKRPSRPENPGIKERCENSGHKILLMVIDQHSEAPMKGSAVEWATLGVSKQYAETLAD